MLGNLFESIKIEFLNKVHIIILQIRLAYIKHLAERMSVINGYKYLTVIKEEIVNLLSIN